MFVFYPAVIITVLKKEKLVMCFVLIMSSSSITNKTYKIEKKQTYTLHTILHFVHSGDDEEAERAEAHMFL